MILRTPRVNKPARAHQIACFEVLHEVGAHAYNALHHGADSQTGNNASIVASPSSKNEDAKLACKKLKFKLRRLLVKLDYMVVFSKPASNYWLRVN